MDRFNRWTGWSEEQPISRSSCPVRGRTLLPPARTPLRETSWATRAKLENPIPRAKASFLKLSPVTSLSSLRIARQSLTTIVDPVQTLLRKARLYFIDPCL